MALELGGLKCQQVEGKSQCQVEGSRENQVVVGSKDIEKWIRQVVAKTHKASGAAICPYAKRALEDRKIQIAVAKVDVLDQIDQCCDLFDCFNLDIVILYFDRKISEKQLAMLCRVGHDKNKEFAVLYDHPKNKGKHKGVSFSYGKAPLIMIQKLDKLKKAQGQLRKSGYYECWGLDPNSEMFY